ncbi:MAG: hypothetical protein IT370_09135 [Deltaproteobacteria bacterium]|nr:hypothetical protein [Deltaproteobacteria bacterium]
MGRAPSAAEIERAAAASAAPAAPALAPAATSPPRAQVGDFETPSIVVDSQIEGAVTSIRDPTGRVQLASLEEVTNVQSHDGFDSGFSQVGTDPSAKPRGLVSHESTENDETT